MIIGPAPIMRMECRSVRFGMVALISQSVQELLGAGMAFGQQPMYGFNAFGAEFQMPMALQSTRRQTHRIPDLASAQAVCDRGMKRIRIKPIAQQATKLLDSFLGVRSGGRMLIRHEQKGFRGGKRGHCLTPGCICSILSARAMRGFHKANETIEEIAAI